MNLERFVRDREPDWAELEAALGRAGGRSDRLGPQGVLRLGRLYRGAAADLALARRAFPEDPVVRRLELLVGKGRSVVYAEASAERETVAGFLATGYWRRVRERPRPLAIAALLLFLPMALAVAWGVDDPGAAIGVLPAEYQGERATSGDLAIAPDEQAALASQIFTNNLQVSFLAFAGGLLAALGTAVVLVFNGLIIGALMGIAIESGEGAVLAELVVPHGVLELTCIVVAAAAGLRVGWALVDPGPRARLAAFSSEARRSVEIVLGTVPWLVLAGVVEGFVTGSGLGLGGAVAAGVSLGLIWWGLLAWRGRPAQVDGSPARAELALTAAPVTSR
ncbi:MAG: stage II sporulation protein M [Actinomycetota bacterium]|nr:stage II sporulation protein M [Actinomycetota bacterium]